MKIFKIIVENYRLLKNFSIDLEDELSLVIGKNNTGKTSILSILDKFLNQPDKNKFSFDDFNIDLNIKLKAFIETPEDIPEENFNQLGIKLKLFIKYSDDDDLSNISRVMMDLDPNNNVSVLGFEYILSFDDYKRLKKDYKDFAIKENAKKQQNSEYKSRSLYNFLKQKHSDYFKINKKSFQFDNNTGLANEDNAIDLIKEKIDTKEIINFKFISAKRDVTNKEADKTLSGQTSRIYARTEASEEQNKAVENFKDRLSESDFYLSDIS